MRVVPEASPYIGNQYLDFEGWSPTQHVHCLINLINVELAMNLLHSFTRTFHSSKSLSVDIRRFNRVYLLL
jgi:hypothetical protein